MLASLEDPEGAARGAHLLRFVARKGNHPARRDKTQQLNPSGHAEHARSYSEAPKAAFITVMNDEHHSKKEADDAMAC